MAIKLYANGAIVGAVDMQIKDAVLDGERLPQDILHSDKLELYKVVSETGWNRLDIELGATDSQSSESPSRLVTRVSCARTMYRAGFRVFQESHSEGNWLSKVAVFSNTVSHRVEIQIAKIDHRGIFMGASSPFEVLLRKPQAPDINGMLSIMWESFSSSQLPLLKAHSAGLYALDTSSARPILYVNRDSEALYRILGSEFPKDSTGQQIKMLESISVARSTWLALALAASSSISDSDEGLDAGEEWKNGVLGELLPAMYPELSDQEALFAAKQASRGSEGMSDFLTRAQLAIDEKLKTEKVVVRAARAMGEE